MAGQWRVTAWCGRLLLFAALVFGIVAMHSLGHCAGHPASPAAGSGAAAHHAPGPEAMAPTRMSLTHGPMDMGGGASSAMAVRDSGATAPEAGPARLSGDDAAPRAHAPLPPGGADPAAVCLAVLTAVSLVLLGAAFARRSADGPGATLARLPHALRPIPPPPHGILLARASVLRL
ncbi:hypothetical protein [Streptomyces sp. NPDC002067]